MPASKGSVPASKGPKQEDEAGFGAGTRAALARVEKASAKLLSQEAAPTMEQLTSVLLSIGDSEWPTQSRPNVTPNGAPVRGMCLGLVYGLGGQGMKVSKVSESCPLLTRLVTRFTAASLPPEAADARFKFSSVQINYNYCARRHVDGNNLGPSYIVALGEHTGGGLWTADRGVLDCRRRWRAFDGTKEHETRPFAGASRVTLIAFTHNAYEELTRDVAGRLAGLGFSACSSERLRDPATSTRRASTSGGPRAARARRRPASSRRGAGRACGRAAAWVAGAARRRRRRRSAAQRIDRKNSVGLHMVEFTLAAPAAGGGPARPRAASSTASTSTTRPRRRPTGCARGRVAAGGHGRRATIADSAIAKTRPPPARVPRAARSARRRATRSRRSATATRSCSSA